MPLTSTPSPKQKAREEKKMTPLLKWMKMNIDEINENGSFWHVS